MNVSEAIQKRYSCRSYLDKKIEKEKLMQVLEAARLAPSARNLQDWRFVVVEDKKTKSKLAEAANNQMFIEKAAAIIVACSVTKDKMRCGQAIGPIDVSIALEHMCLQATELGLATCWIGSFYPDKIRPFLGIPEDVDIVELLPIGYPGDEIGDKKRERLEKIVCFEKWGF